MSKILELRNKRANLWEQTKAFLEEHRGDCIRLPMRQEARSLNLSNAVAITVYEALRQLEFPHLQDYGKMKL